MPKFVAKYVGIIQMRITQAWDILLNGIMVPLFPTSIFVFILCLTDKISVMNESNKTTRGPPKQQPQKQMDQTPQYCLFHSNVIITNICVDRQCLLPLCPHCIPFHIQDHTQRGTVPTIEYLETIRIHTIHEVQKMINSLGQVSDSMSNDSTMNKSRDYVHRRQDQLTIAKQKVQMVVNQYFDQLQQEIQQVVHSHDSNWEQRVRATELNIKAKLDDLQSHFKKLVGANYLKTLIKTSAQVYRQSKDVQLIDCHHQISALQHQSLKIDLDESKLYSLNLELAKYARFVNPRTLPQQASHRRLSETNPYIRQPVTQNLDHPVTTRNSRQSIEPQPQLRYTPQHAPQDDKPKPVGAPQQQVYYPQQQPYNVPQQPPQYGQHYQPQSAQSTTLQPYEPETYQPQQNLQQSYLKPSRYQAQYPAIEKQPASYTNPYAQVPYQDRYYRPETAYQTREAYDHY